MNRVDDYPTQDFKQHHQRFVINFGATAILSQLPLSGSVLRLLLAVNRFEMLAFVAN